LSAIADDAAMPPDAARWFGTLQNNVVQYVPVEKCF
jgi:hypothetical protein